MNRHRSPPHPPSPTRQGISLAGVIEFKEQWRQHPKLTTPDDDLFPSNEGERQELIQKLKSTDGYSNEFGCPVRGDAHTARTAAANVVHH